MAYARKKRQLSDLYVLIQSLVILIVYNVVDSGPAAVECTLWKWGWLAKNCARVKCRTELTLPRFCNEFPVMWCAPVLLINWLPGQPLCPTYWERQEQSSVSQTGNPLIVIFTNHGLSPILLQVNASDSGPRTDILQRMPGKSYQMLPNYVTIETVPPCHTALPHLLIAFHVDYDLFCTLNSLFLDAGVKTREYRIPQSYGFYWE